MSSDSLAVALMAIDDPTVRAQVAEGNFSGLHADVVLSSREEDLLKAAAKEEIDPETSGFDAGSSAFFQAASQVPGNVLSAPVAHAFQGFMGGKVGGLGSAMAGPCACPPMGSIAFGGYSE
ncbi:MAG TPA: hypothetical protein VK277_12070 [Acidimicrobiales bacterium]|nr:hypothetical protein [Acidimicrobiales bacterium]